MHATTSPARAGSSRPAVRRSYTTSAELGELVQTYRRAGRRMREEKLARLSDVLARIAGGVWDKWRFTDDRDEFVQDCLCLFFANCIKNLDPARNPFSYLTTCAKHHGQLRQRELCRRLQAEHGHRAEYVREGRYMTVHHFPEW